MTPKEKPLSRERFFFWRGGWEVERRFTPSEPSVLNHFPTRRDPVAFPQTRFAEASARRKKI